ncbi:MAG: ATP-dependent endonuclease [Succinivibrionaceae bacterium]|nr:ATP-dependent endonuclease [Succinivibrionaceae bacterium]
MHLERVEAHNFRGLRSVCLDLEQDTTTLIGENTWGKTSLLRALWVMLGRDAAPCSFEEQDLYLPIRVDSAAPEGGGEEGGAPSAAEDADYRREDSRFLRHDVYECEPGAIVVELTFREDHPGDATRFRRLRRLAPVWSSSRDGFMRIRWRARGGRTTGGFATTHCFLDQHGREIKGVDVPDQVALLIEMNPVLRLRDSRVHPQDVPTVDGDAPGLDHDSLEVSRKVVELATGTDASAEEINECVRTLDEVFYKYLTNYNGSFVRRVNRRTPESIREVVNRPYSLESMTSLQSLLKSDDLSVNKLLATYLISSLTLSKGKRRFDPQARPILIFEDIESRFHPSMLLSFWSVVNTLPTQKIITTNSCDFVSAQPLSSLRRLCRLRYDTRCYRLNSERFSAQDLRRIAFHVRMSRPIAFFARAWLLVEGETEVWILNEVANLMGISLPCCGLRILEFAQCGLHPLLKLSRQLGISFFVLTDGDEAGQRYAKTVMSFTDYNLGDHLLILPSLDIEHFLYANGFAESFRQAAGINRPLRRGETVDKVIETAIHRQSKPGLALTILDEMRARGPDSVPRLLRMMMYKAQRLGRSPMVLG